MNVPLTQTFTLVEPRNRYNTSIYGFAGLQKRWSLELEGLKLWIVWSGLIADNHKPNVVYWKPELYVSGILLKTRGAIFNTTNGW